MSLFGSFNETTDKATDIGEEYLNTSREYFKLKLFKQLVIVLSYLSKLVVYGILGTLVIIFISISAAIAIGNSVGSSALGFLIMGGILILLTLIALALSKNIDNSIIKKLAKKFFNN